MPDQVKQSVEASSDAQASTEEKSLVQKIGDVFSTVKAKWDEGVALAKQRQLSEMSYEEQRTEKFSSLISQLEYKLKNEIIPLRERYKTGDLKDSADRDQQLLALNTRLKKLWDQRNWAQKETGVIPLTPGETMEREFKKLNKAAQVTLSNPSISVDEQKLAQSYMAQFDKFMSLDWATKEAMAKDMNMEKIRDGVQKMVKSPLERVMDFTMRGSAALGNLTSAYIQLATDDLPSAIADTTLALQYANVFGDADKLKGKDFYQPFKQALVKAGITQAPWNPEGAKQNQAKIDQYQAQIMNILSDPTIPEVVEGKPIVGQRIRGEEPTVTRTFTYPKKEQIDAIKNKLMVEGVKKFANEISPAGAAGLALDVIADPLQVVKPLEMVGLAGRGAGHILGVTAKEGAPLMAKVLEAMPAQLRNSKLIQAAKTTMEAVPESTAVKVLTGEAPLSSFQVVRNISRQFDIASGFGEKTPEIRNAIHNMHGAINERSSQFVVKLEPIMDKLKPVLTNPERQKEFAKAMALMEDTTQGVIKEKAEVFDGLREIARRTQVGRQPGEKIEEYAIRFADERMQYFGDDLDRLRNYVDMKMKKPGLQDAFPTYVKRGVPSDTYALIMDRIDPKVFDVVKESSFGKMALSAEEKEGAQGLLDIYKSEGLANQELGVINSMLPNYTRRKWSLVKGTENPAAIARANWKNSSFMKSRVAGDFMELSDYMAKGGAKLDADVAKHALEYGLSSAKQQSKEEFKQAIERLFDTKRDAWDPEVANMVKYVTEGRDVTKIEKLWRNKFLNNYKQTLLWGRAAYAVRNMVDNGLRMWVAQGPKALVELSSTKGALNVMLEDGIRTVKVGEDSIKGAELFHDFLRTGIIRPASSLLDTTIEGKGVYNYFKSKKSLGQKVWNALPLGPEFSANMENFFRTKTALSVMQREAGKPGMTYEKLLRKGQEAANHTYMNYETMGPLIGVMSNVHPFFRFEAGAAEFWAKEFASNPARVHQVGLLFNSPEANSMSNEEKQSMAPYIAERLKILLGKDAQGVRTWITGMGLSPESLNDMFAFNESGLDVQRTAQKMIAQVPLLNAAIAITTNFDPYFGWSLDSARGKRAYKMFYDNKLLNEMVGGVVEKPVKRLGDGSLKRSFEMANPIQYYKTMNIMLPLITSVGIVGGIQALLKNHPLAKSIAVGAVGGLLSQPGINTIAQMTGDDLSTLEKTLKYAIGARIIKEDTNLSQFYNALTAMQKADGIINDAYNEKMNWLRAGAGDRPDVTQLFEQKKRDNAKRNKD